MDARDPLSVLDRVTQVLQAFDADDGGVSLSELARRSGIPKSTVSRVTAALVEHGYLERDGRVLRLGLRVFELGQLAQDPRGVRAAALPAMVELRDRTGGWVHVGIRDGDEIVCVAVLRGRSVAPYAVRVGTRLRAHDAVAGEIVLDRCSRSPIGQARPAERPSVCDISCASCVFGAPDSELKGEIGVSAHSDGFDVSGVAPFLRAAATALTRRLSARTSPTS